MGFAARSANTPRKVGSILPSCTQSAYATEQPFNPSPAGAGNNSRLKNTEKIPPGVGRTRNSSSRLASIMYPCNGQCIDMATVTVSPKFQVVIPKDVRQGMALSPGDRVEVLQLEGRIEIVPVRPIGSMRGFLKGLKNTFEREDDRCLP
jgi:AbrB family looped-hinge helix DNA binding protein